MWSTYPGSTSRPPHPLLRASMRTGWRGDGRHGGRRVARVHRMLASILRIVAHRERL
jgi:hypothetical protein